MINVVSIHALREESDCEQVYERIPANISIHALREESDQNVRRQTIWNQDFNPRSP